MNQRQKGSVFIILLVGIVVLGVAGFVFYTVNKNQSTQSKQTASTKTESKEQTPTPTTPKTEEYITFPNLGIKVAKSALPPTIGYTYSSGNSYVSFYSVTLDKDIIKSQGEGSEESQSCRNGGGAGRVVRINKSELSNDENAFWMSNASQMKKIVEDGKGTDMGEFYIVFVSPQGACSNLQSDKTPQYVTEPIDDAKKFTLKFIKD